MAFSAFSLQFPPLETAGEEEQLLHLKAREDGGFLAVWWLGLLRLLQWVWV